MNRFHEAYDEIRYGYKHQEGAAAKAYYCLAVLVAFLILLNIPAALIAIAVALWQ